MSSVPISILCFGPGLPAGGQRAVARVLPSRLEIELDDGRVISTPLFTLEVATGGFDHQQLILSWADGADSWSAMPVDADARAALLNCDSTELRARLTRWTKKTAGTRRGFRLGWAALSLVIASPLLLLIVFWSHGERISGWVVDRISLDTERKLGEMSLSQVQSNTRLLKDGPVVDVIRDLGSKLTVSSKYHYQWFVAEDPVVNAFAIPGGFVVVNSGLIAAADSAEEVAGVLAHEVQHVERRHSLKALVQAMGLQTLIQLVLGDVAGEMGAGIVAQLGTLKFGRDHESEADRLGLAALQRAGIDGHGMLRFFEKLARQDGSTLTFLSTHPATADRLEALQRALEAADTHRVESLPIDWASIRASLPNLKGRDATQPARARGPN